MGNNQFDFLKDFLMVYLKDAVNTKSPKCYIKETRQEYSGQVYFTEKIGLHDGQCNQVGYR